jgi:hypothetical protein
MINYFYLALKLKVEDVLFDKCAVACGFVEECLSQKVHIIRVVLVELFTKLGRISILVAENPHALIADVKHRSNGIKAR